MQILKKKEESSHHSDIIEEAWKHGFLFLVNVPTWGHCLAWIHCPEIRSKIHERHVIVQKWNIFILSQFVKTGEKAWGAIPLLW